MDPNLIVIVDEKTPKILGQSYTLNFSIENQGSNTYNDLKAYVLRDTYHEQSYAAIGYCRPGDQLRVSVAVKIQQGRTSIDIPDTYTLELKNGTSTTVKTIVVKEHISNFSETFLSFKPTGSGLVPVGFNVLLFGLAGSTKSSYLNALFTSLDKGDDIIVRAMIGGGSDHSTKNIMFYRLAAGDSKLNINLVDAWGLDNKNYDQFQLQAVLNGMLPQGYEMHANYFDNMRSLVDSSSNAHNRKIHSVIFVVPVASVNNATFMNTTKRYYQAIHDKIANPLVVLSLADTICPSVRDNPNQDSNKVDANLKQMREKVARELNIPQSRIFYSANYMSETRKSFQIDKNTMRIFEAAAKQARENYKLTNNEDIF